MCAHKTRAFGARSARACGVDARARCEIARASRPRGQTRARARTTARARVILGRDWISSGASARDALAIRRLRAGDARWTDV